MTTLSINDLNGSLNNQIGDINLSSNYVWNLINTKQDKLTSSTSLLGNTQREAQANVPLKI